jgi:hypothetical protein
VKKIEPRMTRRRADNDEAKNDKKIRDKNITGPAGGISMRAGWRRRAWRLFSCP